MSSHPLAFVPGTQVARARNAEGALSGMTFAVKDLFAIRGHRPSAGHPDWARTHEGTDADAPAVDALLSAGCDLVGVTIMDELAYSLAGQNPFFGTPRNPRAPERLCGGSSCGSAAAVAGCLCDFALGTDTGGSIRVPASFCGLFGLRPTHGRISSAGVVPLAKSFDTVGFFARDARTFDAVAQVLLTPSALASPAAPRVERVLIADDALALCDAGIPELIEHLGSKVTAELRVPVERVQVAPKGFASLRLAFQRIQAREVIGSHGAWLDAVQPKFSAAVAARIERARELFASQEGVEEDAATVRELTRHLESMLTPGTVLFIPPAPGVAPRIDASEASLDTFRTRTLELTAMASLAGLPQIVMPASEIWGAPVGISFAAARGADELLCSLARLSERVLG